MNNEKRVLQVINNENKFGALVTLYKQTKSTKLIIFTGLCYSVGNTLY